MFYWRPSRSCSLNGTLVERSARKLAPFPLRLSPFDQLTLSPASPFQWPSLQRQEETSSWVQEVVVELVEVVSRLWDKPWQEKPLP